MTAERRNAAWVVRGNATPEEIAAVVAVLTMVAARPSAAPAAMWRRLLPGRHWWSGRRGRGG